VVLFGINEELIVSGATKNTLDCFVHGMFNNFWETHATSHVMLGWNVTKELK
jgi:lipoprotein signal peptidase